MGLYNLVLKESEGKDALGERLRGHGGGSRIVLNPSTTALRTLFGFVPVPNKLSPLCHTHERGCG